MCFGAGGKARLNRRNSSGESPLESRWAATYPDTSPVTSFSSPHGVPVGWGQMLPVAHQPSRGVGLLRSPFEEFCSGKRTDCCPRLPLGLRPARKPSLLFPRAQSQAESPITPVRCAHRLGGQCGPRGCGDPGGRDSQHLSLALPPRRRLRQPAPRLPAPARPHIADATGAPFPAGARATLTSLLLSSRDPLPLGRPPPPRHVPASSLRVPGARWFI